MEEPAHRKFRNFKLMNRKYDGQHLAENDLQKINSIQSLEEWKAKELRFALRELSLRYKEIQRENKALREDFYILLERLDKSEKAKLKKMCTILHV